MLGGNEHRSGTADQTKGQSLCAIKYCTTGSYRGGLGGLSNEIMFQRRSGKNWNLYFRRSGTRAGPGDKYVVPPKYQTRRTSLMVGSFLFVQHVYWAGCPFWVEVPVSPWRDPRPRVTRPPASPWQTCDYYATITSNRL